ncbi:hypothetical protein AR543_01810 [Paenibacillus bovis]|uniref:Uncharacterized protein n=1 Tax=Paenibacillus bovis TaxID=1616788 RepID=A0A172ZB90_9BACL|nr:hypothetical protein AR543_01810 [Paenibacillus bovis]
MIRKIKHVWITIRVTFQYEKMELNRILLQILQNKKQSTWQIIDPIQLCSYFFVLVVPYYSISMTKLCHALGDVFTNESAYSLSKNNEEQRIHWIETYGQIPFLFRKEVFVHELIGVILYCWDSV